MTRLALTLALILMAQAVVALWGTSAMQAQAAFTVVASGLDAPRGLAFGPDGKLYIADGGSGGDEQAEWVPPFRTAKIGTSGRILRLDAGQPTVVASGLQSLSLGPAAEVVGVQDLAFIGSTLYAVVGQMNALPGGRETFSLLVKVNPDGSTQTVADLGRFEREANPDETVPDSNPFGLAVGPDGDLYVAEAGGNATLRVTPGGDVSTFVVWKDNPVPTAIAFAPNGQAYVGFLSRAPFMTGSARVERIENGTPSVAVANLQTVVDIKFGPDGMLYVLEHAAEFVTSPPPPGHRPASGRVLRVTPSGPRPVVTGLNVPTKMAFGPDGALYVSNNGTVPGKAGQVLKVMLPAAGASAVAIPPPPGAAPAAQPSPAAKPAGAPAAAPAAKPAGAPAAAASPVPAQAPSRLPRTGVGPDLAALAIPSAAAGLALMLAGVALRRQRR